jgi:hypothetical protein
MAATAVKRVLRNPIKDNPAAESTPGDRIAMSSPSLAGITTSLAYLAQR